MLMLSIHTRKVVLCLLCLFSRSAFGFLSPAQLLFKCCLLIDDRILGLFERAVEGVIFVERNLSGAILSPGLPKDFFGFGLGIAELVAVSKARYVAIVLQRFDFVLQSLDLGAEIFIANIGLDSCRLSKALA